MKYIYQWSLPYWDIFTWGLGRVVLWIFIIIAVVVFIVWIIEIGYAATRKLKELWWVWTKRCPKCFRS